VGAVMVDDICWNPLAEVGLEAVHAHIYEITQIAREPFACIRIREINKRHSRLPQIPLPYVTIRSFHKIAMLLALFKQSGALSDIWIDPYANFKPLLFKTLQHSFRIRESALVPFEIRPVEFTHPEAVEVEDMQ